MLIIRIWHTNRSCKIKFKSGIFRVRSFKEKNEIRKQIIQMGARKLMSEHKIEIKEIVQVAGQIKAGSSVLFCSSIEVLILGEKVVKDAQGRLQV